MTHRISWVAGALAIGVLCLVAPATARQAPVDIDKLGPQVGARVPEFSGTDQRGRTQTLESLMGREGLMLVFSRSADW